VIFQDYSPLLLAENEPIVRSRKCRNKQLTLKSVVQLMKLEWIWHEAIVQVDKACRFTTTEVLPNHDWKNEQFKGLPWLKCSKYLRITRSNGILLLNRGQLRPIKEFSSVGDHLATRALDRADWKLIRVSFHAPGSRLCFLAQNWVQSRDAHLVVQLFIPGSIGSYPRIPQWILQCTWWVTMYASPFSLGFWIWDPLEL